MQKEPYSLPESDREPMTRQEMQTMQWFMLALSTLMGMKERFRDRLDQVPNGRARLNMAAGQLRSLYEDLKGTINFKQWKHLNTTAVDNEARLVPKFTPMKLNIVYSKEDATELVDAAQAKCRECVNSNEESRECRLRKLMEVVIPLEKYDGMLCPYSRVKWE